MIAKNTAALRRELKSEAIALIESIVAELSERFPDSDLEAQACRLREVLKKKFGVT